MKGYRWMDVKMATRTHTHSNTTHRIDAAITDIN